VVGNLILWGELRPLGEALDPVRHLAAVKGIGEVVARNILLQDLGEEGGMAGNLLRTKTWIGIGIHACLLRDAATHRHLHHHAVAEEEVAAMIDVRGLARAHLGDAMIDFVLCNSA